MNNDKQSFQGEGIMEKGYGFIPKVIMKDKDITIEAKAIYAYLSSYTGAGSTAYPSISLMCGDLNISEARFYKHRKLLVQKGYIVIEKKRNEGGWSNNVYRLPFKPYPQNLSTQNLSTQNLSTQNLSTQNLSTQNLGTKSNSSKSNSIKSNSSSSENHDDGFSEVVKAFQENGFGPITPITSDMLKDLTDRYTSEWVVDAMKESVLANVRRLNYTSRILERWYTDGKDDNTSKNQEKSTNSWAVDAT